jgi:hypothetical protein
MSRRGFLSAAGSAAMIGIVPIHGIGRTRRLPPSDKLNIAGIGIGGMGGANLRNLEAENIVALCDVDPVYASKTIERYPNAKLYRDFRIMLEKQKDIDAVVIGTPDHTHAVISMAAIQAGKHVYCPKPSAGYPRCASGSGRPLRELPNTRTKFSGQSFAVCVGNLFDHGRLLGIQSERIL